MQNRIECSAFSFQGTICALDNLNLNCCIMPKLVMRLQDLVYQPPCFYLQFCTPSSDELKFGFFLPRSLNPQYSQGHLPTWISSIVYDMSLVLTFALLFIVLAALVGEIILCSCSTATWCSRGLHHHIFTWGPYTLWWVPRECVWWWRPLERRCSKSN